MGGVCFICKGVADQPGAKVIQTADSSVVANETAGSAHWECKSCALESLKLQDKQPNSPTTSQRSAGDSARTHNCKPNQRFLFQVLCFFGRCFVKRSYNETSCVYTQRFM